MQNRRILDRMFAEVGVQPVRISRETASSLVIQQRIEDGTIDAGITSDDAFSMRIKALEQRLDTTIVRRGNRYEGLTAEGEAILRHARRILDDVKYLEQELLASRGQITGTLGLGVVPTAAAYAARLAIHLRGVYPDIVVRIETASSLVIQPLFQRLDAH